MKEILIILIGACCLLAIIGVPKSQEFTHEKSKEPFVYKAFQENNQYACVRDQNEFYIGYIGNSSTYTKPKKVELKEISEKNVKLSLSSIEKCKNGHLIKS